MCYDPNKSANNTSTDNSAHQNAKAQVREAYMLALIPIVQEGLALLTDAVKDLRHEMALDRAEREECAPLERELRLKRLKAELEDFDLDREESKIERAERAADREANKVEREARLKKFAGTKRTVNGATH